MLYNLFYANLQLSKSVDYSASYIVIYFIKVIFISPLVGFAMGKLNYEKFMIVLYCYLFISIINLTLINMCSRIIDRLWILPLQPKNEPF